MNLVTTIDRPTVVDVDLFVKRIMSVQYNLVVKFLFHPSSPIDHTPTFLPTCTDPDSFSRGGPTLTTFSFCPFLDNAGERIQIPLKVGHHRPASKRHLNGVSLTGRRVPNIECWLVFSEVLDQYC